jgi:hypothetical protein
MYRGVGAERQRFGGKSLGFHAELACGDTRDRKATVAGGVAEEMAGSIADKGGGDGCAGSVFNGQDQSGLDQRGLSQGGLGAEERRHRRHKGQRAKDRSIGE